MVMNEEDLIRALWGRIEIKAIDKGCSSLRNFCRSNGIDYQRIMGARRRLDFPSLSDLLRISEVLCIGLDDLVFGAALEEVQEGMEGRRKADMRRRTRYHHIIDALQKTDNVRLKAVEIILGLSS